MAFLAKSVNGGGPTSTSLYAVSPQSQQQSMTKENWNLGKEKDKVGFGRKLRCCKILSIVFVALIVLFTVIVLIGSAIEMKKVNAASTTISYYTTAKVCATSGNSGMETFSDVVAAHAANAKVANCGECGHCSNFNDIEIYNHTKETLTSSTTECATKAFFGGADKVRDCMNDNVGFTEDCNTCWVENVMCDMKCCVFTCIKSLVLGGGKQKGGNNKMGASDDSNDLNDCLLCDERLCGPAFIDCAGANRRRSGIHSDIGRDESQEVCKVVDDGWWQ